VSCKQEVTGSIPVGSIPLTAASRAVSDMASSLKLHSIGPAVGPVGCASASSSTVRFPHSAFSINTRNIVLGIRPLVEPKRVRDLPTTCVYAPSLLTNGTVLRKGLIGRQLPRESLVNLGAGSMVRRVREAVWG